MPARITIPSWTAILTKLGINSFPPFQLSEVVQPVAIVDSEITLSATTVPPVYGTPASAGEVAVPAANSRLADTGALAVGNYACSILLGHNDGATNSFRLRRRNAADAADIWAFRFGTISNTPFRLDIAVSLAASERLVLENIGVGGAGTVYQASIFAFKLS